MARFGRLFLITLLLLGLLLSTTAVITGCGEEETTTETKTGTTATVKENGSEVIGQRALKVLASTVTGGGEYGSNSITGEKLAQKLADPAEKAKLFLVDIRSKADFDKGHIEGATQIDFKTWPESANLEKLPKDKKIIVVCYTGNTAAQTAMGMRMLGYDAAVLRAGMNGWTQTSLTPTVVSELANTSNPVVTTPSPSAAAAAPAQGSFDQPSNADYNVILDKAQKVMSDMPSEGDYANYTVTSPKLTEKLADANEKSKLFLIDIRSQADYNKGHIDGAINIPFLATVVPDNLKLLPKDKKIVVVCYTGNTAAMTNTLLRLLDYDAVVLKYGMMGWDGSGKEAYLSEIQAANNPVVTS